MAESFLILFAAGVLLAAAISDPKQVTLQWLRLAGIIALTLIGVGLVFYFAGRGNRSIGDGSLRVEVLIGATILSILLQLGFVQVAWRKSQRMFAASAFVLGTLAGAILLHNTMVQPSAGQGSSVAHNLSLVWLSCAGIGAMVGLALMDMLLGHAYLTASQMTMQPFRRLNGALGAALLVRLLCATGLVLVLNARRPVAMLWGIYGLYILTAGIVAVERAWATDTKVMVRVKILQGFHLMAQDAGAGFVSTALIVNDENAGLVEKIEYPPGEERRYSFADEPIHVYSGQAVIAVSFGQRPSGGRVRMALRYQACDDSSCLPAVTKPLEIPVMT